MIVDAYSHVCPEPLLDAISERHPGAEVAALRKNSYLFDGERRLRYMDRIGVDQQVLVLVRPPMWLGMPRPVIHELTRVANDSIAEMAAAWPDRFIAVGVLPVVDDEMMAEFGRLTTGLGVRGVLIFSNIEGLPLDDASMWPLYEEAAKADVPIWIHPQHGHSYDWIKKDLVDRLFGWPFETTLAMSRLVFGGVLERYPDLKFVTHHLGGMVPFYASRAGGITGLIGPNGAGKSTVLGLVSGFLRLDAGRIVYDGRDVGHMAAHRRSRAGVVRTFQLPHEFRALTTIENLLVAAPGQRGESLAGVAAGRRLWRREEDELVERARALLHLFGMAGQQDRRAGHLSGGQKRMLEVMRALMTGPRLLLLDEPMAGLAPALAERLEAACRQLADGGLSILLVEHELRAVERLCEHVVVMAQGKVISEGRMAELRTRKEVQDAYVVG